MANEIPDAITWPRIPIWDVDPDRNPELPRGDRRAAKGQAEKELGFTWSSAHGQSAQRLAEQPDVMRRDSDAPVVIAQPVDDFEEALGGINASAEIVRPVALHDTKAEA
jgi:hypothetical protein